MTTRSFHSEQPPWRKTYLQSDLCQTSFSVSWNCPKRQAFHFGRTFSDSLGMNWTLKDLCTRSVERPRGSYAVILHLWALKRLFFFVVVLCYTEIVVRNILQRAFSQILLKHLEFSWQSPHSATYEVLWVFSLNIWITYQRVAVYSFTSYSITLRLSPPIPFHSEP